MKHKVCSKMWSDININIPNKVILNCCKREPDKSIGLRTLNQLGSDIFTKRTSLLEDRLSVIKKNELPESCNYCKKSWPQSIWRVWNTWKDKDWTQEELDGLHLKEDVRQIELMLSTKCNQTCMYCAEHISSAWAKVKGLPEQVVHTEWKDKILESLFSYIETIPPGALTFNLLGGEPFLNPEIFSIIDQIMQKKHKQLQINFLITTNLNFPTVILEKLNEYATRYSDAIFYCCASIDAVGEKAQIIRDGLNWDLFEKNIDYILSHRSILLTLAPSISNLSVAEHKNLLQWYLDKYHQFDLIKNSDTRLKISNNIVSTPEAMHPGLLPESYKTFVDEAISVLNKFPQRTSVRSHQSFLVDLRSMIGTTRNEKNLQNARAWYNWQGKIKKIDYFFLLPHLNDILTFDNTIKPHAL